MAHNLHEYQDALTTQASLVAIGKTSAQVAHDIRSPLAALEVVTASLATLPEEQRVLVRGATARIRDIANTLMAQSRALPSAAGDRHAPVDTGARDDHTVVGAAVEELLSVELLSSLIDPLITEKRMQHRGRGGVEIVAELGAQAYGVFAAIQPTEFKRVLSNLVNNAVEGIAGGGTVTVRLRPCGGAVCVEVADTGAGMPPEILSQLTQRGATFGKAGGSGLGLFHARESVERWGGTLTIESAVGKGTTVTVQLPAAAPAAWFVPVLTLRDGMTIVVLDDDQSIHDIWQGRFEGLRSQLPNLVLLHFSTAEETLAWHAEVYLPPTPSLQRRGRDDILYLVDYELLGQPSNGLALIEQLQIAPHAILVTSRYEDPGIRQKCAELGVRLIPKGLAGFVPIQVMVSAEVSPSAIACDCVLIDDDAMIHLVWKVVGKTVGKTIRAFADAETFLAVAQQIAKTTPIYVDSNLGEGIKGEEVTKTIHALGFDHIYLATGYRAADFGPLPWLKGIIGKEPPWSGAIKG